DGVRVAGDLGYHRRRRRPGQRTRAEAGADDRVVGQHLAVRQSAVGGEYGRACRRPRSARRTIDLAVGENRYVALMGAIGGVGEVFVQDGSVDPREPVVFGMFGVLGVVQPLFDLVPAGDQL